MTEVKNTKVSLDKKGARRGYGFRPQSQILIGGRVMTSSQPDRVEMNGAENSLIVYKDNLATVALEEGLITFFLDDPDADFPAASITTFGTPSIWNMVINAFGQVIQIVGHLVPSTSNLYDLGIHLSRWRTIYLINNPDVASDAREKENIKDLELGLEEILKLRPVTYNRIGDEKVSIGLIAQEVKEVLPQLVNGSEDEHYSITYGDALPILINAVKTLAAEVKELKGIMNKT